MINPSLKDEGKTFVLCLDIGNTHIYGGVFLGEKLLVRFRFTTGASTSDEIGTFLKIVLRENNINDNKISRIAICSVVPDVDYSIRAACKKYFSIEPFFLRPDIKTGLEIKYRDPLEVGSDRIANTVAAVNLYPKRNIIIIDYGTATTFCIVSRNKEYLGGVIMPGIKLSMNALQMKTAKLLPVEIIKRDEVLGRSTSESIQSGLYFGVIGASREMINRIQQERFAKDNAVVIATGGFARLFEQENLFEVIIPDLVLQGLKDILNMNEPHT